MAAAIGKMPANIGSRQPCACRFCIEHREFGNVHIHQRESQCPVGAAGTEQQRGPVRSGSNAETVSKGAAEADAVSVEACHAAIGIDGDGIHGADLRSLVGHGIQHWQHRLLAGMRHVQTPEAKPPRSNEQVVKRSPADASGIDQVVVATPTGGAEGILGQRRRQG